MPGKDNTLNKALYKVSQKLKVATPGSVRLTQVRSGGHEVEIYDGACGYSDPTNLRIRLQCYEAAGPVSE